MTPEERKKLDFVYEVARAHRESGCIVLVIALVVILTGTWLMWP